MGLKYDIVGFSFLCNVLIFTLLISFILQQSLSTILFYYIFNLLFFAFIPWVNYTNDVIFWTNLKFTKWDYVFANIILCLYNIYIYIIYKLSKFRKISDLNHIDLNHIQEFKEPNFFFSVLICLICFACVLYSVNFELIRLFFRGLENDEYIGTSDIVMNILVTLGRLIPAFIVMRYVTLKEYFKGFFTFIILLFCAFPSGMARFQVAFIYLPILVVLIPFFRKSINITILIIISLLLIFPFLEQFRYFNLDQKIVFVPSLEFFNAEHFDAYQNFVRVIQVDFITYGYQLLGVIFFFIPRVFWNSKPVGSGYQMAENQGYFFNNISMPYIAEGYVNFGYVGLIIFATVLAYSMKKIDLKYLNPANINFNYTKGVFFCAAIFFMLRGDLMSSFTYLVSGIVAYKIAEKI